MGTIAKSKEQRAKSKIFILHGWSYSTEKWTPFLELLEEKGLKPQLLEVQGLTAPIERPWTLDDYVEWLNSKIGKRKAILVGHSNGGRIALAFALKYPEKLKRLILIDSAGIPRKELKTRLKRVLFGRVARFGKQFTSSDQARNLLHKLARVSDYKEASPEMRQTMINLMSVDLTPELHKVAVPTLIVWGREDRITPLRDAKLMYELIPTARIHVIKDARHSPQFTHPKEVCEKIWQFLTP